MASKGGIHPGFTLEGDIIILLELSASNVHITAIEQTLKHYKDITTNINSNPSVTHEITWNTLHHRYKGFQETFELNDTNNQRLYGEGGGIGKMDAFLMAMTDARADLAIQKNAKPISQRDADRRKYKIDES